MSEAREHRSGRAETDRRARHETRAERADRNFGELVQELRVAQTGVQILFAFLLSLAFLADFPHTPAYERVLTGALLAAAGATICFVAPVAFHRTLFRRGLKEVVVTVTHRLAAIGLGLLALSMALSSWLVLATLWSEQSATVVVVGMLAVIAILWVAVPLLVVRRAENGADSQPDADGEGSEVESDVAG